MTSAILSATSRRAANASACADARSSHCASSTTARSGCSSDASDSTPSAASPTRNAFGARPGAESEGHRKGVALRPWQAFRQGEDRSEELLKGGEGEFDLSLHADGPHDPEPRRRLDRVFEQLGLAHAGLAMDHQRPAAPAACAFEEPVECLALAFSAQQLQRLDLQISAEVSAWARSMTPGSPTRGNWGL